MILATETEGLSRLFDLDFQLLADASLMIIAMFFLFMFASHYLFNPVRKMLQDRQNKIKLLLDFAGRPGGSISDPWYTGEFGTTYNDVLEGCTAFLRYLQQNGRIDT